MIEVMMDEELKTVATLRGSVLSWLFTHHLTDSADEVIRIVEDGLTVIRFDENGGEHSFHIA